MINEEFLMTEEIRMTNDETWWAGAGEFAPHEMGAG
jgi:hypothetical protein